MSAKPKPTAFRPPPSPPEALRLDAGAPKSTKPPFGVARWSDDAAGLALVATRSNETGVFARWPADTERVPDRTMLRSGALVVVILPSEKSWLGKLVGQRNDALRGTEPYAATFVALGYRDVGATQDNAGRGLVWGRA